MNPDQAAALALQALAYVAGDEDALSRLMAESGLSQDDLRRRTEDPVFLGFVLDFLLSQEAQARGFCEVAEVPPETVHRARAALPGGPSHGD